MDAILTDPAEAAAAVIDRLLERGKIDAVGLERARRLDLGARFGQRDDDLALGGHVVHRQGEPARVRLVRRGVTDEQRPAAVAGAG